MQTVTERKKPSIAAAARGRVMGRVAVWTVVVASGMWVSLFLAWQVLSSVNFAYGLIYDWADVDATIAQFGPQNRYKRGLESTTRAERERIFAAIVTSINRDGDGLEAIRYYAQDGRDLGAFLRQPEVVHLRDVANLIATLRSYSYVAIGAFLFGVGFAWWRRWPRPSAQRMLIGILGSAALLSAMVLAYGPTELFYRWHTLVFPDNHQWFFYYQDSLMTTLMRAPVIFGYIAVLLLACGLVLFAAMWWGMARLLASRRAVPEV